ncbi:DNA adenine methylase [Shewanella sp. ISTPL2]|uniref:DNA adenine methylase n=1 Tax=Shewanella sp. ISTPL2 TaxID=2699425 RepID=UPI001568B139|nr:DNA adenine methylase [Shewanella sp. ISTPL2]
MRFYTPLRYPGGKGKLAYYLKEVIKENSLHDKSYIEPYAGGAAVALELLMQEYVRTIHINDIDPAIYGFWHSVINNTDELCKLISDCPVNMDIWNTQKLILANSENHSKLELGFAAFFLNRTNRSGILKAGVIGGKEQTGNWKIDARFNKSDLIDRIQSIANYRSRIFIHNDDTVKLLKKLPQELLTDSLLYLDPPYYVKGQGLYRNFYSHDDHVLVKETISNSKAKNWLVSYDNADEIKQIYNEFRIMEYSLQYTAQDKKVGGEVMIFSDSIKIPDLVIGKKSSMLEQAA